METQPAEKPEEFSTEDIQRWAMAGALRIFNMPLAKIAEMLKNSGQTMSQSEFNSLLVAGMIIEKTEGGITDPERIDKLTQGINKLVEVESSKEANKEE